MASSSGVSTPTIVGKMEKSTQAAAPDAGLPSDRTSRITPYLGLNARLSQTWINKWTILLLLVLARTLIAIVGLHDDIGSAKREALSACTSVEHVGSAMASMPHYLAHGVNELTASGVEKAVHALMATLTLSVTGAEEIIVFAINMLTSTYVCLITLVVAGSLHVAIDLLEDATNFINKTLLTVGSDIQKGISEFDDELNKVVHLLDNFLKASGSDATIPTLNLDSSINELGHIQFPTDWNADLTRLKGSIPTFAQVNNLTQTALRLPFEEVKKLMANHTSNFTFDSSLFPVPAKETLSFCSDDSELSHFFEDMIETVMYGRKIAVIVLCVLATLACVPMAYREMRKWRTMKQRSDLVTAGTYDNMDVVYIVSRPYTATAGINLASHIKSTRRQTLVRWVIAYATTVPALFVLTLGIAGLFSCLCQYILLKVVEREIPGLETDVVNFADNVVYALGNASAQWSNGSNSAILGVQNDLNNDLFKWVNISADALNNTLNTFVDESIHILNITFGGTVLYTPVTELFNCLIGLKVAGIEKGLTWMSDNAHIDFPLLPNDTFSLGAALSKANQTQAASFLADPQTGATDAITGVVDKMISKIQHAILTEFFIALVVVGVWLVILIIGILRALYLWFGTDEAEDDKTAALAKQIAADDPFSDEKRVPTSTAPTTPQAPIPLIIVPPTEHEWQGGRDVSRSVGNEYKGTPYTLKPRPFQAFDATTLPDHNPVRNQVDGWLQPGGAGGENLGYAGARAVGGAVKRPTQFRASSHADVNGGSGTGKVNKGINF